MSREETMRMTAKALPIISEYDPVAAGARCDLCPLKGNVVVPPKAAALPTKLIFVGEAPGRKEEIHGVPFSGQTGSFLRGLCREVDIDFREAALTNSALCRSNIDRENDEASVCCAPRLLRELAEFDPSIPIVTLGKSSTLSVLGVRSIMHARGFVWTAREIDPGPAWSKAKKAKLRGAPKWKELWLKAQIAEGRSKLAGRTVLPTVHPAFVLRSDTWLPILKIDLDRIARWVRGELLPEHLLINSPYVVVSKRDEIRRELRKLSPVISVDIETGASKSGGKDGVDPLRNRILCVGISDGKHTVVIWPWRKTHAPLVNSLFRRVTTIGMHNGFNFDAIALARHGVPFKPYAAKLEDTLIAHHTFASHMPQRLSHVASVFLDNSPWKVTFKRGKDGASEKGIPPEQMSGEELTHYNAVDCVVQAKVWLGMQADLESERAVYKVDKVNAALCMGMIIDGIGIDLERRAQLRAGIVQKEAVLLDKMRVLLRRANFHPMQLSEVRKALFTILGAPLAAADPTDTGLPSTSQTTLERLKTSLTRAGRFADLLLQWRGAVKVRGTYLDSQILDKPSKKTPTFSRPHFNWRSYGAASGRYSCRLQSCPRAEILKDKSVVLETRVREVYVAKPGCKLVYFDLSQCEMRAAAYASGDERFMQTCQGDVHSGNAKILFPSEAELIEAEPKGRGKPFRDVAKNAGFGVTYLAETQTVFEFLRSKGFDVHYKDVAVMMDHMHEAYAGYFRYVQRNVNTVAKTGFIRTLLTGRIRWLGWHSPPTEVANCLDAETEALTQRGWIKGFDLKVGDMLLTKRIDTGEMVWEPISRLRLFPNYSGRLFEFKSKSFNAVTTPEHRWLVRDRRDGVDLCATSEELAKGTGELSIHRTGAYVAPTTAIYTDDIVDLIGWLVTDGSVHRDRFVLYQTKRAHVARIDALLQRLGVRFSKVVRPAKGEERSRTIWRVHAREPLVSFVYRLVPDRTLTLQFLCELTAAQTKLLLTAMMRGDGSTEPTRARFVCRDKARADIFQVLALMCGAATTARWRGPAQPKKQYATIANRPKSNGCWIVTILRRDTAQVLRHPQRYGRAKKKVDQVREFTANVPVWCPVVRNTYFVARRNGDVYITGNTPIQSMIADLMNERLPLISRSLPGGAHVVAQIHDAAIIETPEQHVERVKAIISNVWAVPIVVPAGGRYGGSLKLEEGARSFVMPIELKCKDRWSDL